MNSKVIASGLAALVLTTQMAPAHAQMDLMGAEGPCELDLTGDSTIEWRGLYGRGYEVIGQEQDFEVISVTIRHVGDACDFFIVATPSSGGGENALTSAGERLLWDLRRETSGPSIVSGDFFGTLDSQLFGRFGPGPGVQSIPLYFTIPPGQFVRGGNYSGQALLRLFRVETDVPELVAEWSVAMIAPVASILQIQSDTFPGGLTETTIDLGDISRSSRQAIDFEIISNARVAISAVSQNNGMLAHQFDAPGVPYDLLVNGDRLDVDGRTTQLLDMAQPTSRGIAQVEIVVPESPGALAAGRYSDSLTLTLSADQ